MGNLRVCILVLIAVIGCVWALSGDKAEGGSSVPGDVNCDGFLTAVDALELLKGNVGLPADNACAAVNADFTCDDTAGVADVPQLLREIAGLGAETCVEPGTAADELIDDALSGGQITSDEAVLYKLYYVFDDDRLPDEFAVPKEEGSDATGILKQVAEEYGSLSPQMQQQVGPYLVPPYYAGSWWDLQQGAGVAQPAGQPNCTPNAGPTGCTAHPDWSSVSGSLVKVWYPNTFANGAVHAQATVQQIESQLWPALQAVMQKTPLSDAGRANNGGDGKFDIAILPDTSDNFVEPYTPNDCSAEPAFMVITGSTAQPQGDDTLIHELMHAFQFAFDVQGNRACSEWDWVAEGTSHWAVRHLRPNSEYGDIPAERYLNQTEFSMESSIGGREYGSWIFWYFLTATNSPDLMYNIWLAGEFHEDSLVGVDSAIPGGWEEQLPKFAQYAWNRAPGDYFNQWLGIDHELDGAPSVDVKLEPNGDFQLEAADAPAVEHLGAVYYHFMIDDAVRSFGVYNGLGFTLSEFTGETGSLYSAEYLGETDGLHITALLKIGGAWQDPIDWTYYPYQHYCRDVASERVEEMVLIVTNDEFNDRNDKIMPPGKPISVVANDVGCARWEGSITNVFESDGFMETVTGTGLVFERDPAQVSSIAGAYNVNYLLTGGAIDWEVSGTTGDCTVSGSASGLDPGDSHSLLTVNFIYAGPYHRAAQASIYIQELQTYTLSCPGEPPEQVEKLVALTFPVSGAPYVVPPGDATISGSETFSNLTATADLHPVP